MTKRDPSEVPEEVLQQLFGAHPQEPQESPNLLAMAMALAEAADTIRDTVEAQRRKLVEMGYPESVSWRMAADMWAGVWRNSGGAA